MNELLGCKNKSTPLALFRLKQRGVSSVSIKVATTTDLARDNYSIFLYLPSSVFTKKLYMLRSGPVNDKKKSVAMAPLLAC